jgi:stage II sporulation protein M
VGFAAVETGPVALLVLGVLALIGGLVLTMVFSLFFVFTPLAVAAENLSGLNAMRRSWSVASRNTRTTFAYGAVYVVLTGAISLGASAIPIANLPLSSLASVGVLILVTPVLHLTKTEIYSEVLTSEPVEFLVYKPFFSDLAGELPRSMWRIFRKGLHELRAFALDSRNLGYHMLSAAGIVAGLLLGMWIGDHGLNSAILAMGYIPGRINPLVSGAPPLTTGVYIFFHNWEASLATALSGVWMPAIPFAALLLNGVLIGVVSGLAPNTTMLMAALLPHGIIEVPSFVLAGSAGIKLGVAFMRSFGSSDPKRTEDFHKVARQTVYLIIGLALLFFIAGLIEGNLTPVIMRMYGWT